MGTADPSDRGNPETHGAVITRTRGVDPRDALATSMHASPGVYAVLVGSGMSTAAGIKTAWGVVQDLVRRVAVSEGADLGDLEDVPEEWWVAQGRPELRYDLLLAELASTEAARRALLRRYFDPPPETGQSFLPTRGHHALAQLCAFGLIKVIITTNFDPLIERALEAVGISPQVIASASAIRGMTPIQHVGVTVIKLHGDYAAPGLKNTALEVGSYSAPFRRLLARVLDEYGLVVVGWSGDFDTALVSALEAAATRRYPTYWATYRGSRTRPADRLIAQRQANVIDTTGADDFLGDLLERVGRLNEVATRRRGPSPLRYYQLQPDSGFAPQGWSVLPLLVLRTVAVVSPATAETVGLIGPLERNRFKAALEASPITDRLKNLAGVMPPASAGEDSSTEATPERLDRWHAPPGVHQSSVQARYRLGGDGSSGVSALAEIRMPGIGAGGDVKVILDMGLSLAARIALSVAVELFRDGLVAVTSSLPESMADILPGAAVARLGEVHFLAAPTDGQNHNRPNDLSQRVDLELLESLTEPNPQVHGQLGFAASLGVPLTRRDAAELVVYGINQMALDVGYLDPRRAVRAVRDALDLPPEPSG